MTEATETQRTVQAARTPSGTFEHLLRSLIGRPVTIVDPESFEEAPVGHRIHAASYPAKLIGMGEDYIVLAGEFVHKGAGASNGRTKEVIRHYVPIGKIKRISILGKEPLIHV